MYEFLCEISLNILANLFEWWKARLEARSREQRNISSPTTLDIMIHSVSPQDSLCKWRNCEQRDYTVSLHAYQAAVDATTKVRKRERIQESHEEGKVSDVHITYRKLR